MRIRNIADVCDRPTSRPRDNLSAHYSTTGCVEDNRQRPVKRTGRCDVFEFQLFDKLRRIERNHAKLQGARLGLAEIEQRRIEHQFAACKRPVPTFDFDNLIGSQPERDDSIFHLDARIDHRELHMLPKRRRQRDQVVELNLPRSTGNGAECSGKVERVAAEFARAGNRITIPTDDAAAVDLAINVCNDTECQRRQGLGLQGLTESESIYRKPCLSDAP